MLLTILSNCDPFILCHVFHVYDGAFLGWVCIYHVYNQNDRCWSHTSFNFSCTWFRYLCVPALPTHQALCLSFDNFAVHIVLSLLIQTAIAGVVFRQAIILSDSIITGESYILFARLLCNIGQAQACLRSTRCSFQHSHCYPQQPNSVCKHTFCLDWRLRRFTSNVPVERTTYLDMRLSAGPFIQVYYLFPKAFLSRNPPASLTRQLTSMFVEGVLCCLLRSTRE